LKKQFNWKRFSKKKISVCQNLIFKAKETGREFSFIDITKFDQLKQIEISYHELQEKYHIAERLEEQLKELNRNYNDKILELKQQNELFEKLKFDYERQHIYLVERDENIRLLKIQLEEREQSEKNLIENYQNQMKKIENELEQQRLSLSNASLNQDQHFSSILKQQEELNQQYQTLNIDYEELQINYDQIKDEKNKLTNEIHLLKNRITILEKDNIENVDQTIREENEKLHQMINQLNEKIQTQNSDSNENFQVSWIFVIQKKKNHFFFDFPRN
jgi:chromosome segregation protein